MDTSFLDSKKYLWDKAIMKRIFSEFNDFQNSDSEESKERCFTELLIEYDYAYRSFLEKINDLPMIMSCRTKGDTDSHFGGLECAELMKSLRFSSEKYLKESAYSSDDSAGSVANMVAGVRDKAKKDEKSAWEIERIISRDYVFLGVDNTLEILEKSGYKFGGDENKSGQKTIDFFPPRV